MCIAIITTSHPKYPFILISNRDEYLCRPTSPAAYWDPPHNHILSGRDMERPAHGTWLGITKGGRIACLTNFHEEDAKVVKGAVSRGVIIKNWLTTDEKPEEWAKRLVEDGELEGVGGFTLMYGKLGELGIWDKKSAENGHVNGEGKRPSGLAILSNRTTVGSALPYIAGKANQTIAVSNAPFGDRTWRKVIDGEALLETAIKQSVDAQEDEDRLISRLLKVLSTDAMPAYDGSEEWKAYTRKMQKSVFVRSFPLQGPSSGISGVATPLRTDSPLKGSETEQENPNVPDTSTKAGLYGTQKQTVILADNEGKVTYFERTLFDQDVNPVPKGLGDRKYEFKIEDWE
ncbi:DUF833 domain protein [Rhizodiscina lignyota]|uniref:DUF833 domain protein n=1 Tax=Rhizodiscina lignyota TaxID=1504668 RepID=A0A9P4IF36_9PEZI|nr:DUF833 domain protein [Rhizodiscina lignyota]